MANITFKNSPVTLLGNEVKVGDKAPEFSVFITYLLFRIPDIKPVETNIIITTKIFNDILDILLYLKILINAIKKTIAINISSIYETIVLPNKNSNVDWNSNKKIIIYVNANFVFKISITPSKIKQ